MYIFLDTDEFSVTRGQYSVRDGSMSYDGFATIDEAVKFLRGLL